jgi:hypothetical protein
LRPGLSRTSAGAARDAGVDQHARIGMVDQVQLDRHPLALGEQVGNEDRREVMETRAVMFFRPNGSTRS